MGGGGGVTGPLLLSLSLGHCEPEGAADSAAQHDMPLLTLFDTMCCVQLQQRKSEADEPADGRRSHSAKHCASCQQLKGGQSNCHTPPAGAGGVKQWEG